MTSVDTFVKYLNDSGLLPPGEVQAAAAKLPPAQRQDCRALADTLVQQRKLTKYQANMVIQGKTRGLLLDNYVILEKLGQGGMGKVFLARPRRGPDRALAIKVLPPSASNKTNAVARFKREAKAAAQLRHPNIVATYGAGEDQGVHFLVMEFVDGIDLSQQVKQHGPLQLPHALRCVLQTARGLEHAHGAGVIHRDIKPGNLLVNKTGVVKILDMGLARFDDPESADEPADQLTQDGAIIGTIDYMSPEQAVNSKTADHRSDMYGLGCTLYYLLSGKPMYGGSTPLERLVAHRQMAIPELPGADAALQAIFRRMVAKKADDRYPSMTALIAELEQQQQGANGGLAAVQERLSQLPPSTLRWAALGAGGLIALLLLTLFFRGGGNDANLKAGNPSKATEAISPVRPVVKDDSAAVIELLPLVDIGQDAPRGRWTFQDGALHLEGNNCMLELPYQPPAEYDFRIEFSRQGNGSVEEVLTRGGRHVKFSMGWRDLVGFDRIGGRNIREALPGVTHTYRIEPGRRYTVVVQVRGEGFKAYIDNELVCQVRVDDSQLSMNPNQEPRDPRGLAIAALDINRGAAIYKAEVVEISGAGTFTRPQDPAAQAAARLQKKGQGPAPTPIASPAIEDPARWRHAVNLMPLIDLEQDVLTGRWRVENDGISSEAAPIPKLALPYRPPEEYDFRIEFVRQSGGNGVMQMLSKVNRSFSWEMGIFNNRFMGFAAINGRGTNNSDASVRQGLVNEQRYTSIVQVRNSGLKAFVNGKLISDLPTDYQNMSLANYWNWPAKLELGIGSYQSAATFYRIDVLEVTGRGAFTRPEDPAAKEAEQQRGMR